MAPAGALRYTGVLDAGGTITAQNDYEPYGDNMVVGGATYNERLGFTAKETDRESGFTRTDRSTAMFHLTSMRK